MLGSKAAELLEHEYKLHMAAYREYYTNPARSFDQHGRKQSDEWSNIVIHRHNDSPITMNINAGPNIMGHLLRESKETGFIIVWNGSQTIALDVRTVSGIEIIKLTTNE